MNLFKRKAGNKDAMAALAYAYDEVSNAAHHEAVQPVSSPAASEQPEINLSSPSAYEGASLGSNYTFGIINSLFTGDKFPGGFGITKNYFVDYWTLRIRSIQLFNENLYARGLIQRLITNEINTGLTLEATPEGSILNMSDEEVNEWAENTEKIFQIWGDNKLICSWNKQETLGQLQQSVRRTALLSGDAVIILRQAPATKLFQIEVIDGVHVCNPLDSALSKAASRRGNKIVHGVELDKSGRHVAYYIKQDASKFLNQQNVTTSSEDIKKRNQIIRVPVRGSKSGRMIAWMIYGSPKRVDEVRGMPILAAVLQSLKEIDRFRDSEQRAAVINSLLPLFISKTQAKPGTRPITGGAVKKTDVDITDTDGSTRTKTFANHIPGLIFDELQAGEKPESFDTKRPNLSFSAFQDVIINTVAWANEVPPEIMQLAFSNNYSASRAAINEFKVYLDRIRTDFSNDFCKPIYHEWLINMVLTRRLEAPGLLEAWRNPAEFIVYGAWVSSEWAGAIKPSVDREKEVKAYERMIKHGFITHDRASKELTGTKYSTNIKRLQKENEQKVQAAQPLIDAGLIKSEAFASMEQMEITKEALSDFIKNITEETIEENDYLIQ